MATRSAFARLSPFQGVQPTIAAGLVLLLAALCWVPHLPDSLWLDETLTYWVVRDGLGETLDRTLHYQPQPGYYVFVWFWTQLAGTSETALRLPSLLAALGSCFALAKLGTRLTRDRETGLLAAVVLASTWNLYRESVDARSYMLGLVLLLGLALWFLRWLDEGRWGDAVGVGVSAGVLLNLHVFFVLVYPALLAYAAVRWSGTRAELRQAGSIAALSLVGAGLFLPVARVLMEQGGSYSFVPTPDVKALFQVYLWNPPIFGVLAGTCLGGLLGAVSRSPTEVSVEAPIPPAIPRETHALLAVWMLLPLLVLFGVAVALDRSVFLGRYLIPAIPAVALYYAMVLRRIPSGSGRVVAAIAVVLAAGFLHTRPHDDFRGAALAVNEYVGGDASVPVLFASGLIEGEDERWLRDPVRAAYLRAPVEYYPIDGRVVTLPRRLEGAAMGPGIVDPILARRRRFVAIEWYGNGARVLPWLTARAEREGYRVARRGFGGVRVAVFNFEGG